MSGSTTTWRVSWSRCRAATKRSATTRSPAPCDPRRRTSWAISWKQGRVGRGDRGLPRPGAAPPRRRPPLGLLWSPAQGKGRPCRVDARHSTKAVAILRRKIQLKPDDADAHYVLGQALHDQGKLDEAIAEFRAAVRLRAGLRRSPPSISAWVLSDQGKLDGGDRRIPRGDPTQAGFRRHPQQPRHRPERTGKAGGGDRRVPRGDPAQARLRLRPQRPRQRPERPVGQLDEAIAEYREAIRLKPDYAHPHNNLGSPARTGEAGRGDRRIPRGDPARARTTPAPTSTSGSALRAGEAGRGDRRIPRGDPAQARPSPTAHYNLGIALRDQGKLDEAIAEFREAIRLKPDYAEAHYNLGVALRDQGSWTRRSPNTARRSGSSPTLAERPQSTSARSCATMQGEATTEAIAEYRKAIRLKPDDADAHYSLGNALQRRGSWRGDRRIPRGDPAQARLRRGPQQPRQRPAGPGEAGGGDRRIPRGDPAQARLRRVPTQPRQRPAATRGSWRRRSPSTARPSGSSPTTPMPHNNLGNALHDQGKLEEAIAEYRDGDPAQARLRRGPQQPRQRPAATRGSWTRRSPNTARRSGSSPTTPRPTTTSATPCATRGSWRRRSPNTARPSGSSPTTPRPTTTSATP